MVLLVLPLVQQERCMAVSVAVAVGDIADKLVEKIDSKAQL